MVPLGPVLQQLLDAALTWDVLAWAHSIGIPVTPRFGGSETASGSAGAERTHMATSPDAYVGNVKGKVLQISFSCSEIQWAI